MPLCATRALNPLPCPPSPPALGPGALECRTYGKRIIWQLKTLVGNKSDFDRLMAGVTGEMLHKKVGWMAGPGPPPRKWGKP